MPMAALTINPIVGRKLMYNIFAAVIGFLVAVIGFLVTVLGYLAAVIGFGPGPQGLGPSWTFNSSRSSEGSSCTIYLLL